MGASRDCASGCKPSQGNYCGIGENCPPMDDPYEDWRNAYVQITKAQEKQVSLTSRVIFDPSVFVVAGEYARDGGEPSVVIEVQHAIDADGNDISMSLAGAIASLIREFQ